MSFGFSIGDIILLSQLSYSIYQSLTSGRKNASRDLSELGDVLFGLRCALDHLQHSVVDIARTDDATHPHALRAVETREKLDLMLHNCADTLEDLDNSTRMYRDGADKGVITVEEKSTLTRTARLKRRLASNVMKVRWDMDKDSLRSYREKLSSHADAINLLLSSMMWSTTNNIHVQGGLHSKQLADLYAKVSTENAAIAKLVGDIHEAVVQDRAAFRHTTAMPETLTHGHSAVLDTAAQSKISGGPNLAAIHAIRSGPSVAMFAHAGLDTDIRPHYGQSRFTTPTPPRVQEPAQRPVPNLPPAVIMLNARRRESPLESKSRSKTIAVPLPPARPACFTVAEASVIDLVQGLKYLLTRNARSNPSLKIDVTMWVRLFDNAIDSSAIDLTLIKRPSELVDLLICLNDELDKAPDDRRREFYHASSAAGIDDAFAKVVTLSRSIRAEKEIEDFQDAREDWLEARGIGKI